MMTEKAESERIIITPSPRWKNKTLKKVFQLKVPSKTKRNRRKRVCFSESYR